MKHAMLISLIVGFLLPLSAQSITTDGTAGQDRWSFELRGGAAFTVDKLAGAEPGTGAGFDAAFTYRFLPHLSAYAGWGWNRFPSDNSSLGAGIDFEETGYAFGLQFVHPLESYGVSYMLRAGGLYNHIEAENGSGDIIGDSKHGLGWQAEAGLVIPLSSTTRIVPTLRYRSLERRLTVASVTADAHLQYVTAGIGIDWTL